MYSKAIHFYDKKDVKAISSTSSFFPFKCFILSDLGSTLTTSKMFDRGFLLAVQWLRLHGSL